MGHPWHTGEGVGLVTGGALYCGSPLLRCAPMCVPPCVWTSVCGPLCVHVFTGYPDGSKAEKEFPPKKG